MALRTSNSYKHRIMSTPARKMPRASLGGTSTPPASALSPASTPTRLTASARANLEKKGCLEASVLSVYDLPFEGEVPKAVTLSACGLTVKTGPPLARHKDRNSFRFSADGKSEPTKLVAPLRELYQETLTVKVTYGDPAKYLQAELPLRQLLIHEPKWLILNLSPPPEESSEETTSDDVPPTPPSPSALQKTLSVTEEDMSPPPTIRIKFLLSGPYRTEVAAVVKMAVAWFSVVDKVEGALVGSPLVKAVSGIQGPNINKNLLLIPAVPLLAILVAASPVVAGALIVSVPFLLPIALILIGLVAATLLSGGLVYSSTKSGRHKVGNTISPLIETLVVSRPGQALVYDTGPRPTPVSVCRQVLPASIWAKLWISLVIDLIGSSSYLLPMVGEGFDLAWAPAQTILIMAMYDATSPNLKYLSFMEEVLPFTDVIPSASIGWAYEFLPAVWKDHALKNDIQINPEVTKAVMQLATTAAKMAKNRSESTPMPSAATPTSN